MESKRFFILLTILMAEVGVAYSWYVFTAARVPRITVTDEMKKNISQNISDSVDIITLKQTTEFWKNKTSTKNDFRLCLYYHQKVYSDAVSAFKVSSSASISKLKYTLRRGHLYLIEECTKYITNVGIDINNFRHDFSNEIFKIKPDFYAALKARTKYWNLVHEKFMKIYITFLNLEQTSENDEKRSVNAARDKFTKSIKELETKTRIYVKLIKECMKLI